MSLDNAPILKFIRRTGGTGSTLSTTYLGYDYNQSLTSPASTRAAATWTIENDGPLVRYVVDTYYFAQDPVFATDPYGQVGRKDAIAYIEAVKYACIFRPIAVKNLARGLAVIPKVTESWGDLVNESNSNAVLLSNCTLLSAEVLDDDARLHVTKVRFVFGRVCDAATP